MENELFGPLYSTKFRLLDILLGHLNFFDLYHVIYLFLLNSDYYTNRITQLTEQLQSSDCKTTFYYNEIKSISKHITHLQQLRKRDLHQIEDSTNKLQQLEADLDTTQKGYEHQLNVMSETMLSLNEQLSQRQDEVERLSSDISTKKKTKKNT